ALRLYDQSSEGIADREIIRCHAVLGTFYKYTKRYKLALKHFSTALSLWRMTAGPMDADRSIGAVYYHTADIYYKLRLPYPSSIAQYFYFWNQYRIGQMNSQQRTSSSLTESNPGHINGFSIQILIDLD
ncbi:unnamed protein product, partial [Adineta ricciae]